MKNIEINQGTSNYKDDPEKNYVRFSADFDDEGEALAFHMDLLSCVSKFIVEYSNFKKEKTNA